MTARSYLGRGYESIPGKPFGWAFHAERDEIRRHLQRRPARFGEDMLAAFRMERRIDQIQRRLHKNKPSYAERQAAWRARQPVAGSSSADQLAEALRQIAAGHNDARGLAAEVLTRLGLNVVNQSEEEPGS